MVLVIAFSPTGKGGSRPGMLTPVARTFAARSSAFPSENSSNRMLEQWEEHQPPIRSNTCFGVAVSARSGVQLARLVERSEARNASTRIRLGVSDLSTLGPWVCARRSRDGSRQGSLSRSFGVGPGSAATRLRLGFAARSWFTAAQPLSWTKLLPDNVGPAALGAVLDP